MATEEKPGEWVTVLTKIPSLPLPANAERVPVETERLVIRALTEDDLPAMIELRSRPSVMQYTKRSRPDDDAQMTWDRLYAHLPPNDTTSYNFAICLKGTGDGPDKSRPGPFIGVGGVHVFRGGAGWPEIGYMFHDDHWGKGYASEFVAAFVDMFKALPRPATPQPLRVKRSSVPAGAIADPDADPVEVDEILFATVQSVNLASQKVVKKAGFEEYLVSMEPDWLDPNKQILLHFYRHPLGRKGSE